MTTTDTPLLPGHYYHIYNRGNNGDNIFFEERNYRYFLQLYARHIEPVAETFAYCLLRNHFHVAVRVRTDEERRNQTGAVLETAVLETAVLETGAVLETAPVLEAPVLETAPVLELKPPHRYFNNFFIAYAKAINKAYGRTGSLLEKPYRRKLVDSERYFTRLITYIHQNPQKHGFVDDFRDCPWSSYHIITTSRPTRLGRAFVIEQFGGMNNFVKAHQTTVDEVDFAPLIEEYSF